MLASVKIEWLREASLKLLGGSCAACGDDDKGSLHIHHIIPLKTPSGRGQDRRAWEGLRLAVHQEGLILCPYCHGMLHSKDKMLWMQENKTEAFRAAMRADYLDKMGAVYESDVEIFKCGQG